MRIQVTVEVEVGERDAAWAQERVEALLRHQGLLAEPDADPAGPDPEPPAG